MRRRGSTIAKPLAASWIRNHQDNPDYDTYLDDEAFVAKRFPEPISSPVPSHLRKGGVGRVQRPRQCHHYALRYALAHADEPGLRIVYGAQNGLRTGLLDHSWVELTGNTTFDPNRQEFYRTDAYRALRIVSVIRCYTASEACGLLAGTNHSGPWTEGDCLQHLGYVPGNAT